MAKDTIFRPKFLRQWIRIFKKPQFYYDLGYFVTGHFWPKKAKKRPKNAKKWQKAPFLGQNFCANEFAASKNPNFTMIWGISFRAIFDQKRPKNDLKRPEKGKRHHFRQKILRQWIRSVKRPQFHHDFGYLVPGHFLPKKAKNDLKRLKNGKRHHF